MRNWEGIEAFVAVIREGNFTRAAQALGVSASHVSRRVAELENHLGTTLLYRTTRSIRLSEAGQQYYHECDYVLQNFLRAEARLGEQIQEPAGAITITCGVTFGERYIAPLLPEFMSVYPKISIDLQLSNQTIDLIKDGYDLAIRMGALSDSSLIARKLCARYEYLVATPDYIHQHGSPDSIQALLKHNCLVGSNQTWVFSEHGHRKEIRVKGNWRSNSGEALLHAVKADMGIAQLPDYYVADLIKRGDLVSLLPEYRYPVTGVWLVYPQVRQQLPRLSLLCNYLINKFEQVPWKS